MYYNQVKAYQDNFRNVKVVLYDDLKNDPGSLIADLFDFLGVGHIAPANPDYRIYNASKRRVFPRFSWVESLRGTLRPLYQKMPASLRKYVRSVASSSALYREYSMDERTLSKLRCIFAPEIKRLDTIIKPDLSSWIEDYR